MHMETTQTSCLLIRKLFVSKFAAQKQERKQDTPGCLHKDNNGESTESEFTF